MKRILPVFFLIVIICGNLQAQSELLKTVLHLYTAERYFDCVTEAKRLLFFSENRREKTIASYCAGSSYAAGGFYDNAHEFLRAAEISADSEELQFLCARKRALLFLETGKEDAAVKLIQRFIKPGSSISVQAQLWRYALSVPGNRYADTLSETTKSEELNTIIKAYKSERKKEWPYMLLSFAVPGGAIAALGDIPGGILSFAWTAAAGWLTVYNIEREKNLEAGLSAYFLLARFYGGNVRNTQKLLEDKNTLALTNVRERLLKLLEPSIAEDEKVYLK